MTRPESDYPISATAVATPPSAAGAPADRPRLLVITPVRNEADYLPRTIASLVAQTVHPTLWIIVDDGSTDATAEIATQAAAEHDWIRLYRRPDRGVRKVGGGVIEAFYDGVGQTRLEDFEFVCKLDGDLELGPTYFQRLFEKFAQDPRLGTASGKCWLVTDTGLQRERTRDDFSLGAAKLYRRTCFEDIGGFVREVMWDGIDCHRCRMLGWRAASFHDDELQIRHLRRMGSSFRSIHHGRMRWGYGQYYMGTHPLYALAICCYRMLERPWIVGGVLILAGYLGGHLKKKPRYEDATFRRYLQQWQLARLRLAREPQPVRAIPAPLEGRA